MSGPFLDDDELAVLAGRLDADAWDAFWLAYGIVIREVVAVRVAVVAEPVAVIPEPATPEPLAEPAHIVSAIRQPEPVAAPSPGQYAERICPICGASCRGGVGLSTHTRNAHRVPPTKVVPPAEPAPLPPATNGTAAPFKDRASVAARKTWDERHNPEAPA